MYSEYRFQSKICGFSFYKSGSVWNSKIRLDFFFNFFFSNVDCIPKSMDLDFVESRFMSK
jgi:hypothetical protein